MKKCVLMIFQSFENVCGKLKDDCCRPSNHCRPAGRQSWESPRLYRGARRAVVRKKMGEESYDLEGGGEGEMAFSDKSVRRGFIKKVYAIISVQV